MVTIEKFFETQDISMRRYLYVSGNIQPTRRFKMIENEEKVGFYLTSKVIRMNIRGAFYVQDSLSEYIVYNRGKKKVVMSANSNMVYRYMIDHYFYSSGIIHSLEIKQTRTLCKKIIEGSIQTIGDFLKYVRSYYLRRKDLDVLTVKKFIPKLNTLRVVEDPENVESIDQVMTQLENAIVYGCLFTFKIKDIGQQNKRYHEWFTEQNTVYDKVRTGGPGEDGSVTWEDIKPQAPDVSPELSGEAEVA